MPELARLFAIHIYQSAVGCHDNQKPSSAKTKDSVETNGHDQRLLRYESIKGTEQAPWIYSLQARANSPPISLSIWNEILQLFYDSSVHNLQSSPGWLEKLLGVANHSLLFQVIIFVWMEKKNSYA